MTKRRINQFVFLQECYSTNNCAYMCENEWGSKVFFSHGTNHSKGVMILINPTLDCNVTEFIHDKKGRFIILEVIIEDNPIILVNIYAPNDANQQVSKIYPSL